MQHTDKELLRYYRLGWDDCSEGKISQEIYDKLFLKAYTSGWIDFIAGDDVRSVDYQTEEQILKQIKSII